jgi:DNA-binding XRE family transcriptional regulator
MSPSLLLKTIYQKYPELADLPGKEQKLVKKALLLASQLISREELVSEEEHNRILKSISPKGITPGNSLRAYRHRAGLTQQELAVKSGVSQANISAMEKSSRPIGLNVAIKLAKVLRCDYRKML